MKGDLWDFVAVVGSRFYTQHNLFIYQTPEKHCILFKSSLAPLKPGVPQGSILGPLLLCYSLKRGIMENHLHFFSMISYVILL